ncbi:MDR family MFS transporter [Patulibacter sp. NPDC049589]|uniref:MDR family MFS transporter n=1 Tax=Patulibacter sp. NPDC049589 TaxID=3154731 RepID=UPI00342F37B8
MLRVFQNPKVVVSVVFVAAMFMNILDTTIVNTAIPTIGAQFDATISSTGAVSSAYLVSIAVVIPASGWLGDRFGTRRIFLVALALFTTSSALCGLAGSLGQLVAFRVLQGVGGGMLTPVGMAMLFRVFPPEERIRASKILTIPTAAAPALGPVLGGVLVDGLSWHWAFIVNVPVGIAALAFGLRYLPDHDDSAAETGRFDVPGFLLAGAGLGALMFAITEGPSRGWGSAVIVGSGVAGVVLLVLLVRLELRVRFPMLDLRIFRDRLFRSSTLVVLPSSAGFLGLLYAFPLLQQEGLGRTATESGLLTFPEAIGVMAGSQVVSRIYRRFGPRRLMAGGATTVALMALVLSRFDGDTPAPLVVATMFVLGGGMSFVFIPSQSAVFANISPASTGQASGLFNALRQTGAAMGVAIMATVISVVGTSATGSPSSAGPGLDAYHAAFFTAAALMLVGAAMAWRIRDADAARTMAPPSSPHPTAPAPQAGD